MSVGRKEKSRVPSQITRAQFRFLARSSGPAAVKVSRRKIPPSHTYNRIQPLCFSLSWLKYEFKRRRWRRLEWAKRASLYCCRKRHWHWRAYNGERAVVRSAARELHIIYRRASCAKSDENCSPPGVISIELHARASLWPHVKCTYTRERDDRYGSVTWCANEKRWRRCCCLSIIKRRELVTANCCIEPSGSRGNN